jgi:hypothetical protein
MEMQIKLNNKERLILEQRNVVLEKQIRIEELELQLHELNKRLVEPQQEFLNRNIKSIEKRECGECARAVSMNFRCENNYCCNFSE